MGEKKNLRLGETLSTKVMSGWYRVGLGNKKLKTILLSVANLKFFGHFSNMVQQIEPKLFFFFQSSSGASVLEKIKFVIFLKKKVYLVKLPILSGRIEDQISLFWSHYIHFYSWTPL